MLNLQFIVAQVQAAATASLPSDQVPAADAAPSELPVQSDPTLVNAGLTELDAPTNVAMAKGQGEATYEISAPQNAGLGDGAANPAAEANWDSGKNDDLSASQEWVEVPRDSAETDTGIAATLSAPPNIQSWADEQPEAPIEASHFLV